MHIWKSKKKNVFETTMTVQLNSHCTHFPKSNKLATNVKQLHFTNICSGQKEAIPFSTAFECHMKYSTKYHT